MSKKFNLTKQNYPAPEIIIRGGQIKSAEKLRIVAECLDTLEKEIGIRTVKITLDGMWFCKDLVQDLALIEFGKTPMERILLDILEIN